MSSAVLNPMRCDVLSARRPRDALQLLHRRLPGYVPTEVRELPALADQWGVGRVVAKAETDRFGLPSFKVLGASWAVHLSLLQRAGRPLDTGYDETTRSDIVHAAGLRRLVTATDGNHGRAVAWVARHFGLAAEVLVPAGTTQSRIDAIAAEGAQVHVSSGDYDAACHEAAQRAESDDALLVQDTFLPRHDDVPGWIVDGYRTLLAEVDAVLPPEQVDAVLVPVGVGSLALAVVRHYAAAHAALVAVEPADAGCVQQSLLAGQPVTLPGPYATAMAGLNCGTPNALAWPELSARLDASVLVDDGAAAVGMRALAAAGIQAGATGAAAAAGADVLLSDGDVRKRLGLGPGSTVLLLVTEGVTDPEHFAAVVAGT